MAHATLLRVGFLLYKSELTHSQSRVFAVFSLTKLGVKTEACECD